MNVKNFRYASLLLLSIALLSLSLSANATHFRGGGITWQAVELDADGQINDVNITVKTAWAFGNGTIPNIAILPSLSAPQVSNSSINIGSSYTLRTTVFQAKNLDLSTKYLVSFSGGARIGPLLNNANGNWNIQSVIFLKDDNLAPKIDLPILYDVPQLQSDGSTTLADFSFKVNTADPNADQVQFRLANSTEMGGGSNPAGFAIDANTGVVTWTGSGALASGLYSAGIIAEDLDSTGAVKSKSGADFILDLQNQAEVQFTTTGGIPSSNTVVVNKGDTFNFAVSSGTSIITSASLGDLDGTLTEPTENNYVFTPGAIGSGLEPGTYPVTIEVVDSGGLTTNSYLPLTFIVVNPNAPQLTNIEGDTTTYSIVAQQLIDAGLDAVLTDADSPDLNGGSLKLQVIFIDSEFESLGITSVGDGVGEIRVTGSEIFYEGNKIGEINSIENGVGTALQIQFTSSNASLVAVQALVRSLNYTDMFLLRDISIRNLTLFIADGDANSSSYRLNVDVQGHPSAPTSGAPLEASNRMTLQDGGSLVLTTSQLRYADPDTAATSITLNVSGLANGRFELVTNAGAGISSFTQDQVNNGQVRFVHDGNGLLPAYSISADDGVNAVTSPSAATVFFSVVSTGSASVAENITTVATVTSSAISSPTSFSIISGDDRTLFNIDSSTGELTFISAPDADSPSDADSDNVYIVDVRITDGQSNDIKTMSITVTNVNEINITSDASINVNESSSTVITVIAQDELSSTIVYSLSGGVDQSDFTINSSSGELNFSNVSDFESPSDSDTNNTYTVIVTADANGVSTSQTITVTVINVDEMPVFTSTPSFMPTEGSTAVGSITAQDPESSNLTFSLTGGADVSAFSMTTSGVLSFNTVPDFDAPMDSDADNSYVVEVTVSDGSLSAVQTVTVNVQNLNEVAITSNEGASIASINVNENSSAAATVVAQDELSSTIVYSLSGGVDQSEFTINSSSGELRFANVPDFENPSDSDANNTYTVIVTANANGVSTSQTITVTVIDVDEAPVFTNISSFMPMEGDTVAGTLTAQDPESSSLTFSLTGGADMNAFSLTTSGVLSFNTTPDFNAPTDSDSNNSYIVEITVSDGSSSAAQTVTVNVQANLVPDTDSDGVPDTFEKSTTDTDGDGMANNQDTDSDGDGVSDSIEIGVNGSDTDGDGIDDFFDVDQTGGIDANGDGIDDNPSFKDTDRDGIPDYLDKDDANTSENALGGDSDGDGIPDQVECPSYPACADSDNDGIPDYSDSDTATVSNSLQPVGTALSGGGAMNPLILLSFLLFRFIRTQKRIVIMAATLYVIFVASVVNAADLNWYGGMGVGVSKLDPDTGRTVFTVDDDIDKGYKVFLGYKIKKDWFVEIDYRDLGTVTMETFGEIDYKTFGLSGRYNFFDYNLAGNELVFYAKLGLGVLDNKANIPFNDERSTQISYGIGAEYTLVKSLSLRTEMERYSGDASFLSISLVKYFGRKLH